MAPSPYQPDISAETPQLEASDDRGTRTSLSLITLTEPTLSSSITGPKRVERSRDRREAPYRVNIFGTPAYENFGQDRKPPTGTFLISCSLNASVVSRHKKKKKISQIPAADQQVASSLSGVVDHRHGEVSPAMRYFTGQHAKRHSGDITFGHQGWA